MTTNIFKNSKYFLDKKKRFLFFKTEKKRLILKILLLNLNKSKNFNKNKYFYLYLLNNLTRNSSKTRIKNRCILTGRSRGVFRLTKLSRIKFKELITKGLITNFIRK